MKQAYIRAMAVLHRFCLVVSIVCLVVMTLIIPWGVFVRYVLSDRSHWPDILAPVLEAMDRLLGHDSSWPEPMAILLMVIFAFFSAAACYRDNLHISVMALPDAVSGRTRIALGWAAEIGMIATNLFMVVYGIELVHLTFNQVIAEFPLLSVGLTYLPIPIGGAITLLFVIERLWTGAFFAAVDDSIVGSTSTE